MSGEERPAPFVEAKTHVRWTRVFHGSKRRSRAATSSDGDLKRSDTNAKVSADNPIQTASQDVLGRAAAAESFVKQALSIDAAAGVVVAVLGRWGAGKTSFVNLSRRHFADAGVTVLDFNPWMFSGANHLVDSFFAEVSAELKLRPNLAQIGRASTNTVKRFPDLAGCPLSAHGLSADVLQRRGWGNCYNERNPALPRCG